MERHGGGSILEDFQLIADFGRQDVLHLGGNLAHFHDRAFHLPKRCCHFLADVLQQLFPVRRFGLV